MTQPSQQGHVRNTGPHLDRALYEQPTGDHDAADQAPSAFFWFQRTTPEVVPREVDDPTWTASQPGSEDGHAAARRRARYIARRAAEPDKPASPATAGKCSPHLTPNEISYFIARDPDRFFEEDFHRDLEFDRAIDREPELE